MKSELKVAIVITTMNRPDYMIRQLGYYAKVGCPHPIYIGDASNPENSKKIKLVVEELKQRLVINYYTQPEKCPIPESRLDLYNKVKEEFCTFSGDDDYQIPNSLTKCAEFLKNNLDYSSASGYCITFRLTNDGVLGPLKRLDEYPRFEISNPTAGDRLIELMMNFTIPEFSVQRTKNMKKCWQWSHQFKDTSFPNDIVPSAVSAILGKAKIIDCLAMVRQLGNPKAKPIKTFDWITEENWLDSYNLFCKTMAEEIASIDKVALSEAYLSPQRAMWGYLSIWLPYEYKKIHSADIQIPKKTEVLKNLKFKIGQKLPWIKQLYLNNIRYMPKKKIFHEAVEPSSSYYKDFKPVLDSFTGNS